jgi:WD40 repeat protein
MRVGLDIEKAKQQNVISGELKLNVGVYDFPLEHDLFGDLEVWTEERADLWGILDEPSPDPSDEARSCAFSSDGTYLAVGTIFASEEYLRIYKYTKSGEIEDFVALSQPIWTTGPTGIVNSCAFSHDNKFLAVAHATTPYLTIYSISSDVFTEILDFYTYTTEQPTGTGMFCEFSPDDKYLLVGHSTTPYFTMYKNNGDRFIKLPDLDGASLPAGNVTGGAWSPTGNYFALSCVSSPYIFMYKNNGDDNFTKLSTPLDVAITGSANSCCFSKNGNHFVVAFDGSPYINVYKDDGDDTFSQLSYPVVGDLPTSNAKFCVFSPDDKYLVVLQASSTYVNVYKHTGDVFKKISNNFNSDPTVSTLGYQCAFSDDNMYVAVACVGAGGGVNAVNIFRRKDNFRKLLTDAPSWIPAGGDIPGATPLCCDISSDGVYLAVGTGSSPYLYIYKNDGTGTFTKITAPSVASGVSDLKFSNNGNYLMASAGSQPYYYIFSRSSDTFSSMTLPISLPAGGSGKCCSVSNDGVYFVGAGSHGGGYNQYHLFKRSSNVLTSLIAPVSFTTNQVEDCSFSADGKFLTMGLINSPYLCILGRESDTFYNLSIMTLWASVYYCDISSDGTYVALAQGSSLIILKKTNQTYFAYLSTTSFTNCYGISFSSDSLYLSIGSTMYKRTGDNFYALNSYLIPSVGGTPVDFRFSFNKMYFAMVHNASPYIALFKYGGGRGTRLSSSSHYYLYKENSGMTAASGSTVYSYIHVFNSTYQSCALYLYYHAISDFMRADDITEKIIDVDDSVITLATGKYYKVADSTDTNKFIVKAGSDSDSVSVDTSGGVLLSAYKGASVLTNIVPSVDDSVSLGSNSLRYDSLHVDTIDESEIITNGASLEINRFYYVTGISDLYLPSDASGGDTIEIFTEDGCRILQTDAQHVISYLNKYSTTSGIYSAWAGYLSLPSKTRIKLIYMTPGSGIVKKRTGDRASYLSSINSATYGAFSTYGGMSFSIDDNYFALARASGQNPGFAIYRHYNASYGDITPAISDTDITTDVQLSIDGNYLGVTKTTTPFFKLLKRTGDYSFALVSTPLDVIPTAQANGCAFSHDLQNLAIVGNAAQSIYTNDGDDTFTHLGNVAYTVGNHCEFSYDDKYFAVAGQPPAIYVWKRNGKSSFVYVFSDSLSGATASGCSFSRDGKYLAVVYDTAPYLAIYKIDENDVFTLLPTVSNLPPGACYKCQFSYDSMRLVVTHYGNSPYFSTYDRVGDTFTKETSAYGWIPVAVRDISISNDSKYFVVGANATPVDVLMSSETSVSKAWEVASLEVLNDTDIDSMFR